MAADPPTWDDSPPGEERIESGYPLSYQEALRSLGALLDDAGVGRANVTVDDAGIRVEAPGGFGVRRFRWDEVVAIQQEPAGLRGKIPPSDRPALTRWEMLLRLGGGALDGTPLRRFALHAALAPLDDPTRCYIEVTLEGRRVLGVSEVVDQLEQVEAIRRAREAPRSWDETERL